MATGTFERKIEISQKNAMKRSDRVVNDAKMKNPYLPLHIQQKIQTGVSSY